MSAATRLALPEDSQGLAHSLGRFRRAWAGVHGWGIGLQMMYGHRSCSHVT